jgi:hypothetical protein
VCVHGGEASVWALDSQGSVWARGTPRHWGGWAGDSEATAEAEAAAEEAELGRWTRPSDDGRVSPRQQQQAATKSGFTEETLARLCVAPARTHTPGSDVALIEGIRNRLKETTRHLYVRLLRWLPTARLLFRLIFYV